MDKSHSIRIKQELAKAGISGYALRKAEARYLPTLIKDDEHIMAAVYGRADTGGAMLVATDRRIIFLDKKPLIVTTDEISYEVVSGVGISRESGLFAALTIHTRMGDYTIRFVNPAAARRFDHYIGKVRLEGSPRPDTRRSRPVESVGPIQQATTQGPIDPRAVMFLQTHELAVLSTMSREGQIHCSTVYYTFDPDQYLAYVLTKAGTAKAHNILATHQVALTVYDEQNRQTVQANGYAEIEPDLAKKQKAFDQIGRKREYADGMHHPPVTKIHDGAFIVFRVSLHMMSYSEFK